MKRCLLIFFVFIFTFGMYGCINDENAISSGMRMRENLLASNGCSFRVAVTADYGDRLYTFCADCAADKQGNVTFTITEPETISGVSGKISETEAALVFDNNVLAFPPLTDGELTPVIAPWIFIHTLRSGYLTACGRIEGGYQIILDDSYEGEALQLEIYTDEALSPQLCNIIWQGRRVLSVKITNFVYL